MPPGSLVMITEDRECRRNIMNSETNILAPTLAIVAATLLLCASCTIAEMPLDHQLRGPGGRPALAAYPSSHFATHRTAHGFRGGMSCAKR